MPLEREPEQPETDHFQCIIAASDVREWKTLDERAKKLRVKLRKEFGKMFHAWLGEVKAELDAMAPVRALRSKAEE